MPGQGATPAPRDPPAPPIPSLHPRNVGSGQATPLPPHPGGPAPPDDDPSWGDVPARMGQGVSDRDGGTPVFMASTGQTVARPQSQRGVGDPPTTKSTSSTRIWGRAGNNGQEEGMQPPAPLSPSSPLSPLSPPKHQSIHKTASLRSTPTSPNTGPAPGRAWQDGDGARWTEGGAGTGTGGVPSPPPAIHPQGYLRGFGVVLGF